MVEAQRRRIVTMLLKGNIYGLPGSTGTVSDNLLYLLAPWSPLTMLHHRWMPSYREKCVVIYGRVVFYFYR